MVCCSSFADQGRRAHKRVRAGRRVFGWEGRGVKWCWIPMHPQPCAQAQHTRQPATATSNHQPRAAGRGQQPAASSQQPAASSQQRPAASVQRSGQRARARARIQESGARRGRPATPWALVVVVALALGTRWLWWSGGGCPGCCGLRLWLWFWQPLWLWLVGLELSELVVVPWLCMSGCSICMAHGACIWSLT
jgi:hypothetical protein